MGQNLLSRETSPYLLQHKDNPVHWMAWGEAALAKARAEDKPILLSVGYAACHWCHVMAHESFEDAETAAVMNALFVNVKVDREERPDIDRIYMDALLALGEQGGWPLTMFLAPDGSPFWGGTYFPKQASHGRPSFVYVLEEVARIWRQERGKIDQNREALMRALRQGRQQDLPGQVTPAQINTAATTIRSAMDLQSGGLRGAPKFPQFPLLEFLWQQHLAAGDELAGAAVTVSLEALCQGGIYDHLAGGLSRYSVDSQWLVPHFEKMLSDNAQFIQLLARHWTLSQNPLFRVRIEETVRFLVESMRSGDGAFTTSHDADSEGEEGKYYVWQKAEIEEVLDPDDAAFFTQIYGVTDAGNWERRNILHRLGQSRLLSTEDEGRLGQCRATLLARRNTRIPPGHDDKILADWNGLAIKAIAEAGLRLGRQDWIAQAKRAFHAVMSLLWREDQLLHSARAGQTRGIGTVDDHANLIDAALGLYRATAEPSYLQQAQLLLDSLIRDHWDSERGGFFYASARAGDVLIRGRYSHDDASPAGNGTLLRLLMQMHLLTGEADYQTKAIQIRQAFSNSAISNPFAHGAMLSALAFEINLPQFVLVGAKPEDAISRACLGLPCTETVTLYASPEQSFPPGHPAHGKTSKNNAPTLYLCRGMRCSLPIEDPEAIQAAWDSLN